SGGTTAWKRIPFKGAETADLSSVAIGAPGHAVAVGSAGEVLVLRDDRVTRGERVGRAPYRAVAVVGDRIFAATPSKVIELDGNGDPVTAHEPKSHDPAEPDVDLLMMASRPDGTLYIGGAEEMWVLSGSSLQTMATWVGTLRGLVPTPDGDILVITKGSVQRLILR